MKSRLNYRKFVFPTIAGLVLGSALGYLATKYAWGFGYPAAIVMVLGCAYGIEIIDSLVAASLFPKLEGYPRGRKLFYQILSSTLIHIFGWFLTVWIAGKIIGFSLFQWKVFIWLAIFLVVYIVASAIHHLSNFYNELKQKDALAEKLKALADQAELKALKAQINPHFLFNSLNTVASLINTAPEKAEEAVEKLADIFRYTLSSSNREFVTLGEELDFLGSYLDMEKARFGDRLEVTKHVKPEVLNIRVPSLILQPLVENCLKHGTSKEGYAKIEIQCFLNGNAVKIEVRDQGQGIPEEIKKSIYYTKGTGLKNVDERLRKVYGEAYGLAIKDNKPKGTLAIVTIPVESV
jgi:sensor histidine kinase YesM